MLFIQIDGTPKMYLHLHDENEPHWHDAQVEEFDVNIWHRGSKVHSKLNSFTEFTNVFKADPFHFHLVERVVGMEFEEINNSRNFSF